MRAVKELVGNKVVSREVFRVEFGTGIAANPFMEFFFRAERSGPIELEWQDESGAHGEARAELMVIA